MGRMNKGLGFLVTVIILPRLGCSQSGDDICGVNKIYPGEASERHLLHKIHSTILNNCVSNICVAAVSCKDICRIKCPHCTFMEFSKVTDFEYNFSYFLLLTASESVACQINNRKSIKTDIFR